MREVNRVDLRKKVRALRGLEKVAKIIPGYKGYKEKELRREADELLRMDLARKFDEQRRRLPGLQRRLIEAKRLDLVDDLEGAVMKLQTLVDRLRTASYGYAGFFDAIKVKEKELDALYEFDNALLDEVPKVADGIDGLSKAINSGEGIAEAIASLVAIVEGVEDTLGRRQDVIVSQ